MDPAATSRPSTLSVRQEEPGGAETFVSRIGATGSVRSALPGDHIGVFCTTPAVDVGCSVSSPELPARRRAPDLSGALKQGVVGAGAPP